MDLNKMYLEEDLFPREITSYEERDYGYLFYNMQNKDSYDSNHAVIFKDKIDNIDKVLQDILDFYEKRHITPNIYQSIREEGYFDDIQEELKKYGFEYWIEEQKYMVLSDKNNIKPNLEITVRKVSKWDDIYGKEIFEKAGEPWGINVIKRAMMNDNTLMFVAFYKEKPVGMTYCHITDSVCRVDYLLVSNEFRNIGVGRTIIHSFVHYCSENHIENCYLWPDGETAEKIYYDAGFRYVETRKAGRAVKNGST